jgi:para-aminobenzoate synthetase/4-amino-4-deoxychorismate lyase
VEIACVRFDDLSRGGSGSFGLLDPIDTMVARRPDDVISTLQQAEAAAADGLWVAGYVAYEAAAAVNPILTVRPAGLRDRMRELPLARFQTFRRRIPLDEIDSKHFLAGDYNVSGWTADSTPEEYRDHLAAMGRAIMSGEVSQLKHTFRLHAAFSGDPAALYRDLLLSQRGPHAACLDVGRFRIVSASPQGFFRRVGDTLVVRPVLATARRGRWLEEDKHLAETLRLSGENDFLNRLVVKETEAEMAELGELLSVPESERYIVERLETVWQLTAQLAVKLRPEASLVSIFEALFPLASLTGVPKVEAMALLAATEESARGAYCGTIGFLAPGTNGAVDASFNVAVRTVVVDEDEGVAEFGVGAAITNRSEVVSAFEEARVKAKVLVDRRPDFHLMATVRYEDGEVIAAERKLAALADSAEYFGYDTGYDALRETLSQSAGGLTADGVITVRVGRDGTVTTDVAPAPQWHEGPDDPELLLGVVAEHRVSTENVYLFHNTSNTRLADALSREHPDVDVVVICNQRDEVAGSIEGNVVALCAGEWVTPPVGCGTVPTSFRDRLLADKKVVERKLTREELLAADGVAVIDDTAGWRNVELLA